MTDYHVARKKMVAEQMTARGVQDPRVLDVMGRIPRHEFVDPGMARQAYEDHPLNIGLKQTISQPYMVAFMTEALELKGSESVLEIGTGCGYQTAVLCELCRHIFSIERLSSLSNRARRVLYHLGYINFSLRIGDGTLGWPEKAPFDAILVTAGATEIPQALLKELKEGGRLVMPRGGAESQELVRVRKKRGRFTEEFLGDCRFVKLVGEHGWREEREVG